MLRTPHGFCSSPSSYCQTSGNPDARWATNEGYNWFDCLVDEGIGGDWMIRGYFNNSNNYGEDFDHYNLYRGRTLATMEKLVEVDKDSTGYTETLYAPYGGYFYQLKASYADGGENTTQRPKIGSQQTHFQDQKEHQKTNLCTKDPNRAHN